MITWVEYAMNALEDPHHLNVTLLDSLNGTRGVDKDILDQMIFIDNPEPLHIELILLHCCKVKELEKIGYLYYSDDRCAISVPYRRSSMTFR